MKVPPVYNTIAVVVAIGIIFISTATLSWFSYRYTVGRENLAETTLVQYNIKLATQYVDRIEQKIIDNDGILSEMIDINEPSKWPVTIDAIRRSDLSVDMVYFLRPGRNYPLYPPYSYEIRNLWGAFHDNFKVKELNLDHLTRDQMNHLHKERPNNYFFASYVLKENRKGEKILVCYQMNFDKIVALLDKYLRDLQKEFYVGVVDFENNGIYNQPISRSSKYYYETRFPSTLYKWILQMVPRNYTELEQEVRGQRRTNFFFIILSTFLIFLSLGVIFVAGRRERQLRRLKEDFIGNVSHELKTPLSLIGMFSEILVTGRVSKEETKREYYNIIHNESDRMSRLINNLLDFASLGRGGNSKHFERTNIAQLVKEGLEVYRHEIQRDGFQIDVDVDSGVPDTYADPNAITMAFFNLLDNSVKYSGDQKQIKIRVEQKNGCIDLAVSDEGIGISSAEQQKIFEKFYRGNSASVRKIRGSGIGLSITKHVAEMHGGEVLVESEPGRGSTFVLRIPIRQPPASLGPPSDAQDSDRGR
jgi:two-component system, OmpR family, phosphate regulon sensor histidine kinase PhoR